MVIFLSDRIPRLKKHILSVHGSVVCSHTVGAHIVIYQLQRNPFSFTVLSCIVVM